MTGRALTGGGIPHTSLDHIAMAPEDRIGRRPRRRRGRIVRRLLLLATIGGAGLVHWSDPALWPKAWELASAAATDVIGSFARSLTATTSAPTGKVTSAPATTNAARAEPPPKEAAHSPATAPREIGGQGASPATTAPWAVPSDEQPSPLSAPATPASEPAAVASAPPPSVAAVPDAPPRDNDDATGREPAPPGDPIRRRAESAGLHPDLSRALLLRLTDADFRNAAVAVRTAVAETPENGAHAWPRNGTPSVAVFRVHFVPGADTGCRRYVVTIAKDGWLTTALPMERCGAGNAKRAAAR